MNHSIIRVLMGVAFVVMTQFSADAACTISTSQDMILGGLETQAVGGQTLFGVPNYDQNNFGKVSDNDCGPVAAAMLLGYHDANGWECMVEGSNPASETYYDSDNAPSAALDDMVNQLRNEFPYDEDNGTWNLGFVFPMVNGMLGGTIKDVAVSRDGGASGWGWDDDEWVDKDTIMDEVSADRPLVFLIMIPDLVDAVDGVNASWNSVNGSDSYISFHFLTALGYREVVKGWNSYFFGCLDYGVLDDFYVINRSGWREGGDSTLWYHWLGGDMADLYTIEMTPGGEPECDPAGTCVDSCGSKSQGECWCDSSCLSYGDCCDDYVLECKDEPTCLGACGGSFDTCTCNSYVYMWSNFFALFYGGTGLPYCADHQLLCN